MDYADILKTFGPQAIPWIALAYLGKWHLERIDREIESRFKMTAAIEAITKVVERLADGKHS